MQPLRLITFSSAFQGQDVDSIRANHHELIDALEQYFVITWVIAKDGKLPCLASFDGLTLVFIASGGTEGAAVANYAHLPKPLRLLTDGKANSLAASLELACWVRQQRGECEILHDEISNLVNRLYHDYCC